MRASRRTAILSLLLLGACTGSPQPAADTVVPPTEPAPASHPAADAAPAPPAASAAPSAEIPDGLLLVRGTFGGDPLLEGGLVWLATDDGRLSVTWPPGFRVDAAKTELIGPDGTVVARAGDTLRLVGAPLDDVLTIGMVGTPWRAERVLTSD